MSRKLVLKGYTTPRSRHARSPCISTVWAITHSRFKDRKSGEQDVGRSKRGPGCGPSRSRGFYVDTLSDSGPSPAELHGVWGEERGGL